MGGIVAGHKSLRAQLNRARNKNVTVTEWPAEKAHNDPRLIECLHNWLAMKGLPPLHFMVEPDTLGRLFDRRVFVAERDGAVVGFVVLSPVATRNGWLFEQFPHAPGAPNGTVELMIDTAMRVLAEDGYDYATLGLSPLSVRAPRSRLSITRSGFGYYLPGCASTVSAFIISTASMHSRPNFNPADGNPSSPYPTRKISHPARSMRSFRPLAKMLRSALC